MSSFQFKHNISSGTLINGVKYRAKIRVGNADGTWSEFSDFVIFIALSTPQVSFIPIVDNTIKNQSYEFSANYTHPNGEKLQSYNYILYDSSGQKIRIYPTIFADGTQPLNQVVNDFDNDKRYQIQLVITTVNGQNYSTEKLSFLVRFLDAKINTLIEPKNICEEGAIKIDLIAKRVLLELYDDRGEKVENNNIQYIDGEKLKIPEGYDLYINDLIDIKDNTFTLQIWAEDITHPLIMRFYGANEELVSVVYRSNRFHAVVLPSRAVPNAVVNVSAHYVSNEINIEGKQWTLMLRYNNGMIDLMADLLN